MKNIFYFVISLFVLVGCSDKDKSFDGSQFQTLMKNLYQEDRFNGAVIVGLRGNVLYEGAWGVANKKQNAIFTTDTPIDGASIAKTFTATAIWMLIEEGRLSPEDYVIDHLDYYPHSNTKIKHLIDHSAGLPEWTNADGKSNKELIKSFRQQPSFVPGSQFSYCNACYDVLALLIEEVSGRSWADFLELRLFEPLNMKSTFLRPPNLSDWQGVRTLSYRLENDSFVEFDIFDKEAFYGSANLYFSATDLHKWVSAMVKDEVIPSSIKSAAFENASFRFGANSSMNRLNWYNASSNGPFYFNGHFRGFHHDIYWDPKTGVTVVWVSNVLEARPPAQLLTRALVRIAAGEQVDLSLKLEFDSTKQRIDKSLLEGKYSIEGVGTIQVSLDGDKVMFRINDSPPYQGYPSHGFYIPEFDAEVGFSNITGAGYETLHWLSVFDYTSGERID